jgi:translation initiation factor IF-2
VLRNRGGLRRKWAPKRFAEDAREVLEGFECGILVDGFNDLKEGDVLEAYETREVAREA